MVFGSMLLACTPIAEHEHNFVEVPQVEATCGHDGIRAHKECTICRYWFDEQGNKVDEREYVIPATGKHDFKEGTCTVCGATDPNWQGGGGDVDPDDPDNPDNPDDPDEPTVLAWLEGEWTQFNEEKPWTLTFDGKTMELTYYHAGTENHITITKFIETSDSKATFTDGVTAGECTVTKINDYLITVSINGENASLDKKTEPVDPDAEYAPGVKKMIDEQGFKLTKYEFVDASTHEKNGDYIEFISGKQVYIKYTYLDHSSTPAREIKIDGEYNIRQAKLVDPAKSVAWNIDIDGKLPSNTIWWNARFEKTGLYEWMGTTEEDICWVVPEDTFIYYGGGNFSFKRGADFVFPEGAKGVEGIWDYYSKDGADEGRNHSQMTVNVEDNVIVIENFGGVKTTCKFDDAFVWKMKSGQEFYMLHYVDPNNDNVEGWLRYNPYNDRLITKEPYFAYTHQDINAAIPYNGDLPADLKGDYTLAGKGTFTITSKSDVVFTPAQGDKANYVVTKVADGENETTKKVTIALANQKNTKIEFIYNLADNTLTSGADVYVGENLYVTPADNIPASLKGTFEYDGEISGWYYVFGAENNYKVTSQKGDSDPIDYYVTKYDVATKTLTLTQVSDPATGHKINQNGATAIVVNMVYDAEQNTLTVKGDASNPDKVFKLSAADREVVLPEGLNGTYYVEGNAKYIDILGYDVTLSGFDAAAKLNGTYGINGYDADSGVISLKAKDASATVETTTITFKGNAVTLGSETFVKGRPVKFSGVFYTLSAKFTVSETTVIEEALDGTQTEYEITGGKEEKNTSGSRYGWTMTLKVKTGTGESTSLWYDYLADGCKASASATGAITHIRDPHASTEGVPTEITGTYVLMTQLAEDGSYKEIKLVVDLTNGTFILGDSRYFIDRYNAEDKKLTVKFASEYTFGFDPANPDEIIEYTSIGYAVRTYTRKIDLSKLPEALRKGGSFYRKTETIDFDMSTMLVYITPAKGKNVDRNTNKVLDPTPVVYSFIRYADGVITLKKVTDNIYTEFYYDASADTLKSKKDDADVYAMRTCEAADGITVLRGTFVSGTVSLTFEGVANVIVKESGADGDTFYQYRVKGFDKEAGKITLFLGGSEADIVLTYDAKASTLTAGKDVYTLTGLPAGLDGTYKTSDGKQIVIYMGSLVLTGSTSYISQDDTYTVAYTVNNDVTNYKSLCCKPDDSSHHDTFYLAIGSDGSLTSGNYGVDGTYVKEEVEEPKPEIKLPEGLSGTFYTNNSTLTFDGYKITEALLSGETYTYTIISCTLDDNGGGFVITRDDNQNNYNRYYVIADDCLKDNLTGSGSSKYAVRKPATVITDSPLKGASFVAEYTDDFGENTVTFTCDEEGYVIKTTITKKTDGTETTLYNHYFVYSYNEEDGKIALFSCGSGSTSTSLTYDKTKNSFMSVGRTYTKVGGEEAPELVVPEVFNGIFVGTKSAYIFDKTVNVKVRKIDGTTEEWEIIAATNEEGNYSVTIKSKSDKEAQPVKLTYDNEKLKGESGSIVGFKRTLADNIPQEVYGTWENGSDTIEIAEDGFVVISGKMYLITMCIDDQIFADMAMTVRLTFDKDADTINDGTKDYTRAGSVGPEKATLPEGSAGTYFAEGNQKNYIEVSDDGVKGHIDGEDSTPRKLAKVEGNTVTLDNDETLVYNAENFSFTYGGVKYIEQSHYEFTSEFEFPEDFYGKYIYTSSKYIEIRANDTFYWHDTSSPSNEGLWNITSWESKSLTGVKEGAPSNIITFSWKEDTSHKMTLSRNGANYVKYPTPVPCTNLPESVAGKYVNGTNYYVFDGTNVIYHQDNGSYGSQESKYIVTAYNEETKKISITTEDGKSTISFTYDPEAGTLTYSLGTFTKESA